MVARARHATGPFVVRRDRASGLALPVVAASARWRAPGHNATVADARGRLWLMYHAVDVRRPRAAAADDMNSRRVVVLDRLVFRGGWPAVARGAPSASERPAPAISRPAHRNAR